MKMRLKVKLKKIVHTILTANASPHEVALGCAVGIFVAFVPIVPVQTVLLFPLMIFIPRLNRALTYGVSWVMNPFTIVPIYVIEFWTGRLFFPDTGRINAEVLTSLIHNQAFGKLWHTGYSVVFALLTGGLIWAVFLSLLTYFSIFSLLKWREKRGDCHKTDH